MNSSNNNTHSWSAADQASAQKRKSDFSPESTPNTIDVDTFPHPGLDPNNRQHGHNHCRSKDTTALQRATSSLSTPTAPNILCLPDEILLKILHNLAWKQLLPCQAISKGFRKLVRTVFIDRLVCANSSPIPHYDPKEKRSTYRTSPKDMETSSFSDNCRSNSLEPLTAGLELVLFPERGRIPLRREMYQSIRFLCTGADRQREHLFYTPDPRICSQTSHLKVSLKKPRLQPRETEAATSAWTLSDRLTSPRNSTAIGLDIFDYASGKRRASTDDRSGGGLSSMGFMTMGGAHSMSTGLTSLMRFESRFLGDRRRLALDQNLDHDHDHDQDHYSVIGVRHDLWSQDEQSIEESWGMDMEKVRPHTTTSLTWCASGQAIASTSTASIGDVTMSHQHQFVGSSHSKVVPHMCLHHKRNDRAGIKKTLYDMSECSLDPPMTSTGPVNFLAAYETRLVESEGCGSCQLRCRSEQEIQMYWSRVEVSLDWVLAGMAPISTVSTKMRPAEKDCR